MSTMPKSLSTPGLPPVPTDTPAGEMATTLAYIWAWVKDLKDDEPRHPHNEEYHAVVGRIQKLLKPLFLPSAEERASRLLTENEELRRRIAQLEEQAKHSVRFDHSNDKSG